MQRFVINSESHQKLVQSSKNRCHTYDQTDSLLRGLQWQHFVLAVVNVFHGLSKLTSKEGTAVVQLTGAKCMLNMLNVFLHQPYKTS